MIEELCNELANEYNRKPLDVLRDYDRINRELRYNEPNKDEEYYKEETIKRQKLLYLGSSMKPKSIYYRM